MGGDERKGGQVCSDGENCRPDVRPCLAEPRLGFPKLFLAIPGTEVGRSVEGKST